MESDKNLSFLGHLEELRWRLVKISASILVVAVVLFYFQEWILNYFFLSMSKPTFFTFDIMCKWFGICLNEIPLSVQSTTMSGQFSYALMMSIMGGIVLSFPFIFYQIWSFVKPGLKSKEKEMVKGIVFYVSLLFFLGILFGYFIVAPLTVQFFGAYQISTEVQYYLLFFILDSYSFFLLLFIYSLNWELLHRLFLRNTENTPLLGS